MIKKMLTSQKGASSVLVILMLLVLVVFGIAALTTALSGMRLGQKVSEWNNGYYAAEGIAMHRWAQIDNAVSKADSGETDGFSGELQKQLDKLDFETATEWNGSAARISYDAWSGDIGLHVVLLLNVKGGCKLSAAQWRQIQ